MANTEIEKDIADPHGIPRPSTDDISHEGFDAVPGADNLPEGVTPITEAPSLRPESLPESRDVGRVATSDVETESIFEEPDPEKSIPRLAIRLSRRGNPDSMYKGTRVHRQKPTPIRKMRQHDTLARLNKVGATKRHGQKPESELQSRTDTALNYVQKNGADRRHNQSSL